MAVSQIEAMKFLFCKKPASRVFDANPRSFTYPVLIPESQAKTLPFDQIMFDYPNDRLNRREFMVYDYFKDKYGTESNHFFNGIAGFERQRGLAISTGKRFPNLVEHGNFRWEGDSDPGLRFYFLPESQILWSIEESWKYPRKLQWEIEAVYAVVPDSILEQC